MQAYYPQNINKTNLQTPLSIDDFVSLEQLSNSNRKKCIKAQYIKTGEIFDIKAISKELLKNKYSNLDYIREKAILYDLTKRNHPHIVQLYADFEDQNHMYLVMEFCEGTSLDKLRGNAQGGYVDQRLVIDILTQLLETLAYLHDTCYIMNRNIRPDNIILQKNNNVKLLDFGLAAYLTHQNKQLVSNKSLRGAKLFAPPEILLYPPPLNYDCKVDVFSLGFTIYSLMNPSQGTQLNLPLITEGNYGNMKRYENKIINNFYEPWLIEFVKLLYENDPTKRPTASNALNLLKQLQTNPNLMGINNNLFIYNDDIPQINNNNFNDMANNNLINENQRLAFELNQYKKENEELKNHINYLKNENNRLNNDLIKANNNQQGNNNEINYLKEIIKLKDKEINNLTTQLKNSANNKKLINYDDIIVVNFISFDQSINCGIKCLGTETFAEVEEKFYQQYANYRETNNSFLTKGRLILRFKTLSENGIKNGDIVQLICEQN